VNVAQGWTVIGVLGAFSLALVALMSQFLVAKVDQILTLVSASEERLGARIDRLDGRMDALEGRMDGLDGRMDALEGRMDALDGRMDALDRDVQALANRVFRDDP
jgi:outer membrane murein-binding lipoprotein Lpp